MWEVRGREEPPARTRAVDRWRNPVQISDVRHGRYDVITPTPDNNAEEGEITAIVPQFVLFEIAYVLDGFYKVPPPKIGDAIRATLAYPGVIITDDCSSARIVRREITDVPYNHLHDPAPPPRPFPLPRMFGGAGVE